MYEKAVVDMLKRRGLVPGRFNPVENLIFQPGMDPALEKRFYEMLKKYSFRLFMRDVIKKRKSFTVENLTRYSSPRWVKAYIDFLVEKDLARPIGRGGRYRLVSERVFSFGDTLEWFVARVLAWEFGCPALWGVTLKGMGGDFDVIASLENRPLYIEVKSSPPRNVEEVEIRAFLERARSLRPEVAVFLEDTRLRMKDKIVPFFEDFLPERGLEVKRIRGETFTVAGKVYITNSKPDLVSNIALCLAHFLRPATFLS